MTSCRSWRSNQLDMIIVVDRLQWCANVKFQLVKNVIKNQLSAFLLDFTKYIYIVASRPLASMPLNDNNRDLDLKYTNHRQRWIDKLLRIRAHNSHSVTEDTVTLTDSAMGVVKKFTNAETNWKPLLCVIKFPEVSILVNEQFVVVTQSQFYVVLMSNNHGTRIILSCCVSSSFS